MTTRGFQLIFLMLLLGMAFSPGCVLSQRDVQRPRRVGSDALNLNALDLETIIAGMKHHDSLVTSATGDFVIERYKHGGAEFEKIEYALTFEGEKVQVQVDRGWGPSFEEKIFSFGGNVASLVGRAFPIAEIYDAERHWEIYDQKEPLLSVEITRDDERKLIEVIRQAFMQQGIELADDVRVAARRHPDSFTLIENETDKTYLVLWIGELTLKVYDLYPEHLEYVESYHSQLQYGSRHKWRTLCELDPRYWLTYPTIPVGTYLTEPMWQLLKKYASKRLGTETLNGERTSVVQLHLPSVRGREAARHLPYQTLKIWISHEKGFRVVKWERMFTEKSGEAWSRFKTGVAYIETLEFDYHEYLPGIYFPQKIERSFAPMITADPRREWHPPRKGRVILKSVLLAERCQLNTNVAKEFHRLDVSPETPAYNSLKTGTEKLAALHRVYPRVLERRLAALELIENEELAQFAQKDPELRLLRNQADELGSDLLHITVRYNGEYAMFTRDLSAYEPGGDFYELMEQNHIAFGPAERDKQ
ncbi:hypothetical protein C6500_03430 [Candidatus Poribacteria bacterium]|nr:MAG: hypothetical protein C6500_03430 [Candidatus Poribacteria bacterium]